MDPTHGKTPTGTATATTNQKMRPIQTASHNAKQRPTIPMTTDMRTTDFFYNGSNAEGISDACPSEWGNSTRRLSAYAYGCRPDGDGYTDTYGYDIDQRRASELTNSVMPSPTKDTITTVMAMIGDNPTGVDGDQCPDEAGVQDGTPLQQRLRCWLSTHRRGRHGRRRRSSTNLTRFVPTPRRVSRSTRKAVHNPGWTMMRMVSRTMWTCVLIPQQVPPSMPKDAVKSNAHRIQMAMGSTTPDDCPNTEAGQEVKERLFTGATTRMRTVFLTKTLVTTRRRHTFSPTAAPMRVRWIPISMVMATRAFTLTIWARHRPSCQSNRRRFPQRSHTVV